MADQINIAEMRGSWRGTVQAVFGAIVLALLVWMFDTVQDISLSLVRQTEQIKSLALQIDFVSNQANDDRYRGADAKKDLALRDERMGGLTSDVTNSFALRDEAIIAMDKRLERIERIIDSMTRGGLGK